MNAPQSAREEVTSRVDPPTLGGLFVAQRKSIILALILAGASFWVFGTLDRWTLAGALTFGVLLGLINHLVTEYWLGQVISSGKTFTKSQLTRSTMLRLAVLTAVALGIAIWLRPDGVGVLLGLAIFRLIALAMTSIPLLKELKSA